MCQAFRTGVMNRTALAAVSVLWSSQVGLSVISESIEETAANALRLMSRGNRFRNAGCIPLRNEQHPVRIDRLSATIVAACKRTLRRCDCLAVAQ